MSENAVTRIRRRDGKAATAAEVLRRVQVGIDNGLLAHGHQQLIDGAEGRWTAVLTDPDGDQTEAVVTVEIR
jgi:hypothetical protein